MAQAVAQAMTSANEKLIYTARVHTTGGREKGEAKSDDGRLHVMLSMPGGPGAGTNPEQLLAAGWSACFESAMAIAAGKMKVTLPADLAIDIEVDLKSAHGGYFLGARMNVSLPGLDGDIARQIVDAAHALCPYSKALHGRIDLVTNLV
jgi:lipoyl-dependent peroxiredoxin